MITYMTNTVVNTNLSNTSKTNPKYLRKPKTHSNVLLQKAPVKMIHTLVIRALDTKDLASFTLKAIKDFLANKPGVQLELEVVIFFPLKILPSTKHIICSIAEEKLLLEKLHDLNFLIADLENILHVPLLENTSDSAPKYKNYAHEAVKQLKRAAEKLKNMPRFHPYIEGTVNADTLDDPVTSRKYVEIIGEAIKSLPNVKLATTDRIRETLVLGWTNVPAKKLIEKYPSPILVNMTVESLQKEIDELNIKSILPLTVLPAKIIE